MVFINDLLEQNARQHSEASSSESASVSTSRAAGVKALPMSRFLFEPEQVQQHLARHIQGQPAVLDGLRQQLNVIKAGLSDDRRPLLTALFLGDTGVGKTETVRRLDEAIHGDANRICRIDMNTLSQSHYSAAITGAPPGYVGSKDNLTLLDDELIQGTATRPGIVLFDEIEKASPEVVRSLMNILDNGQLTLASGQKSLSFRNSLVFMTSNLGSRDWQQARWRQKLPLAWHGGMKQKMQQRALERHFDAEFLNRIHCIERFNNLGGDQLPAIVRSLENDLNKRLAKRQLRLMLDDACLFWLGRGGASSTTGSSKHQSSKHPSSKYHQGFEQYGARAVQRLFQRSVVAPLADYLLQLPGSDQPRLIHAHLTGDQLAFEAEPVPEILQDKPDSPTGPAKAATSSSQPVSFPTAVNATQGENHD